MKCAVKSASAKVNRGISAIGTATSNEDFQFLTKWMPNDVRLGMVSCMAFLARNAHPEKVSVPSCTCIHKLACSVSGLLRPCSYTWQSVHRNRKKSAGLIFEIGQGVFWFLVVFFFPAFVFPGYFLQ